MPNDEQPWSDLPPDKTSFAVPFEDVPFEVDRVTWKDEGEEDGEPIGPLILFNRALNEADTCRDFGYRPAGQFRIAWTTLKKARAVAAAYHQELETF